MDTIQIICFSIALASFAGMIILFILMLKSAKDIAKLENTKDEQWESIDENKAHIKQLVTDHFNLKFKVDNESEEKSLIPDINKLNEKI